MHIFPQEHQSLHTLTGKRWELRCQGDAPPARVWPAVQPWRLRSVKSGGRIKEESKSVTVGFQTGSTGSTDGWRGCAIRGWSARVLADRARASDHKTPSKQSDGPNMSEEDVGGAAAKLDWVMNSQQTFTRVPFNQVVVVVCLSKNFTENASNSRIKFLVFMTRMLALTFSESSSPHLHGMSSCHVIGWWDAR